MVWLISLKYTLGKVRKVVRSYFNLHDTNNHQVYNFQEWAATKKQQYVSNQRKLINWIKFVFIHFLLESLFSLISDHQSLYNRLLIKPQIKGERTHHLADWKFNNLFIQINNFFSFHTLSNAEIITSLYLWPGRKKFPFLSVNKPAN